jgi:hypothetical protein
MIFIHGGIHKIDGEYLECAGCFVERLHLKLRMSVVGKFNGQLLADNACVG